MMSIKYEPLTRENCALLLIDHQLGLLAGVRDYPISDIKNNVVSLAKAAKIMGIPIVASTTMSQGLWGPWLPELKNLLPEIEPIDRTLMNAFLDQQFLKAIKKIGRKKLIFAGISLEVCVGFPAVTAAHMGYEVYVAVDASGSPAVLNHELAVLRMQQSGIILSNYTTLMSEVLTDNAAKDAEAVYSALNIPWAGLLGQIHRAYTE